MSRIVENREKVIIYGTGALSHLTLKALTEKGLIVESFCDANYAKWDELHLGLPVISPTRLFADYKDSNVFICVNRQFRVVQDTLVLHGIKNVYDIIDITENVPIDSFAGFTDDFIESFMELYKYSVLTGNNDTEKLGLQIVSFIITQRCTLNCKCCLNTHLPAEKKYDVPTETVIADIDRVVKMFDSLHSIVLTGGEPLLHRGLPAIVAYINDTYPQIKKISLFTNGTLVPEGILEKLSHYQNIVFSLSNYGVLSAKMEELKAALTGYNFAWRVIDYQNEKEAFWIDFGDLSKRNRSPDALKRVFASCGSKSCTCILEGKIFNCGNISKMENMGIPWEPGSYIDLYDKSHPVEAIREKILNYMFGADYNPMCDYCGGGDFTAQHVKPGLQKG